MSKFLWREMEIYAHKGLKIHYLFRGHADCIGNWPTPFPLLLKKINLKAVILDFHAPCLTPASPCWGGKVCNIIVKTEIHHSLAFGAAMMSFDEDTENYNEAVYLVFVCVRHTYTKRHSCCSLRPSRRSLTSICLCSAWSQWLASPDWLDGMARVCTNKAGCPSLLLISPHFNRNRHWIPFHVLPSCWFLHEFVMKNLLTSNI